MNKNIENILACPKCKSKLSLQKDNIPCLKCKSNYKIINNTPVFLDKLSYDEISEESFRDKLRKNTKLFRIFKKIHNVLGPPDSNYSKRARVKSGKVDFPVKYTIRENDLILNIGSSSKKIYSNAINLDIGLFENVDVVADGKEIPFKDNSFDLVLIESVLEHVDEPERVIKEAYRVLKSRGRIYISIPFVFVFHGSPNDFNRYTLNGLKKRLEITGFKIKRLGIISGPSSTISQMLRYYLATLFSFNNDFLFSLFLNIFGWITFPIKYFDIVLNKYKKAHLMASIIYAIGEK
ncbi:methyltransferase domain-containing protein [Candidatus Woesearchaeota archaeon]|nr:methyltransferase domain-containing protein [Candidatus Woesearchaeota archaeon]